MPSSAESRSGCPLLISCIRISHINQLFIYIPLYARLPVLLNNMLLSFNILKPSHILSERPLNSATRIEFWHSKQRISRIPHNEVDGDVEARKEFKQLHTTCGVSRGDT